MTPEHKRSILLLLSVLTVTLVGCNRMTVSSETKAVKNEVVVESETSIEVISKLMADAGHEETMLQMSTGDPNQLLKMWTVGDGVLIVTYNSKTSLATRIDYNVSSDGPKLHRKNWSFTVDKFSPETGKLTILLNGKT